MRNSEVLLKLDMGIVLDQTRMTAEDVIGLLSVLDLNELPIEPVAHILRDVDTDKVEFLQDLQSDYVPQRERFKFRP